MSMKAPAMAALMAASAAAAVTALELVTRYVMRPHPVPAEMADDVLQLEKTGYRVAQVCPVGCHHRRQVHIHAVTPGGMALSITPSCQAEPDPRKVCLS